HIPPVARLSSAAEQPRALCVSFLRHGGSELRCKDRDNPMFFFFSNRLGCAGSLLISLALTLILLFLFRVI
ncbi:MAG: hypothetical protein QOF19_2733, partial [Alphaproteobacteria bacterium]|nr:hypothetical protein [Alphaproteobacteria bacterium]